MQTRTLKKIALELLDKYYTAVHDYIELADDVCGMDSDYIGQKHNLREEIKRYKAEIESASRQND